MAARTARGHGRWFDLLATVLIGVVVVGAALVPAVTANSGETATIRGDVSVGGERLAFFPVGFWTPGDGVDGRITRTDANGVFTLEVPVTLDGYAFAGTAPDAETAILASDGRDVIRGTIGALAATPIDSPLYQGWEPATARALSGGDAQLHFHLQEAGRIGGTSPIPAERVRALQVRRLDGSVVETVELDGRGRWRSRLLAPGRYAVALVPKAPLLPVAVQVDVPADDVVRAVLPEPQRGAIIDGAVRTASDVAEPDGAAVGSGVPVLLSQDGEVVADTETDAVGRYRFTGLAAGDYEVEAGRFAAVETGTPAPSAVEVPIPGRTAAPAPTPTSTLPTPVASPLPSAQAVEPPEQVSDAVRPAATAVTVPAALGEVTAVTSVEPAGALAGRVSGADGVPVQVVAEDADGRVLRAVDAAADGTYALRGLDRGAQYTVWAVTRPEDPTQARMGSTTGPVTASASGLDIELDRPAASMRGTVVDAEDGSVTVGDASLLTRASAVDASGAYVVQGLVPGLYPVVVDTGERLAADPVAVTVTEDAGSQDLRPGPVAAVYRGWFISGGAGVSLVSGTASSTAGAAVRFGPRAEEGHLRIGGLRPGTYTYDADSFAGTVPVVDGPWWFDAPDGAFALSDGATTDVGPVVLHVRAR